MSRLVIDTNVPIVANGKTSPQGGRKHSIECRLASVKFLEACLTSDIILLDSAGDIQREYRKHLQANGQPGVGDRFYQEILNSSPSKIERIKLPKNTDGEYEDIPDALKEAGFDPSDRKFAALAKRENVPVCNAVDGDWVDHHKLLEENNIQVRFICGCDNAGWFEDS